MGAYIVAGILLFFFLIAVWAHVADRIRQRRIRRETEKIIPWIADHLQPDRSYNIFLSHGKTLNNVRFIGLTPDRESTGYLPLPFPLSQWLIVEKASGGRAYIKPETVRYYEDAEDGPASR